MPNEINPFEPWRPRRGPEDEGPPRDLPDDDMLRPWRDARRPQPSDPESEPEWYRQPRAPEPAWTPDKESSGGGVGFVWITLGLVVVTLIVWGVNGGSHVSRAGTAGAALWLGLLLALVIGRGWRWWGRLSWVVCGVAG